MSADTEWRKAGTVYDVYMVGGATANVTANVTAWPKFGTKQPTSVTVTPSDGGAAVDARFVSCDVCRYTRVTSRPCPTDVTRLDAKLLAIQSRSMS